MRLSLLLPALALLTAASSPAQTFVFKGERWEINDPFKMDNSIPPKPVVDPKKGTINVIKGTIDRTSNQGGIEVTLTRKLSEVTEVVWPIPSRLKEAQANVSRGEPAKALDNVEAVLKFFEPIKNVPGSWWVKAAIVKIDALDRLENDAATAAFLDTLDKEEAAKLPEVATQIQLARLMQRARKGDHDAVVKEATDLLTKADSAELQARLHIVKANSLLASKKYEAAMTTYLRVPVFFGSETEFIPKALLGAARSFRGMDSPALREQKLEAISNRYLYDIIVSYPVSKEAEEAKKMLPKEERAKAEADQKKIAAGGPLPEGVIMAKPKLADEEKVEANK
ncbi:MAG: hypothetical protein RJA95_14 [Verrucomicrobiota bacterium]|jgi:hypothetical protein